MDAIRNLLLDYTSTPHAQEILENSLINLMSLKEKELPEEFKSPCWEEKGRETISNLIRGYQFFSKMTPDYCISFPHIMSQFVSEELHNKFISDAIVHTNHIKKSKLKCSILCHRTYLPYLLMTDCSPEDLVTKYPSDPKKVIDSMVELYHNYFDIEHFDIEAHVLAARKSLVYEIKTTIMFH